MQPQNQQPSYYDANGQPVYESQTPEHVPDPYSQLQQPAQPVVTEVVQPSPEPPVVASHVTAQPDIQDGQSYDPQARVQYANEPRVIHVTREVEPEKREISDDLKRRHEESKLRYPHLNLSEGETVILNLQRHPIGLVVPLATGGVVLLVLMASLIFYPMNAEELQLPSYGLFAMIAGLIMILVGIGTYIAVWVYLKNQFFMTNESVIQELQYSLFSKREQTVSLGSIEDASFRQSGIFQTMLNYGTVRLSTEGEETTYRFQYVENPRDQVAILNNGIEAFKNGRPVDLNGYSD